MKSESDERVIPFSHLKLLPLTLGSYACAAGAAGTVYLSLTGPGRSVGGVLFGALCFVLFAALAVYFTRKLMDRKPGLVLAPDGFWINTGYDPPRIVPWSEIHRFDVQSREGATQLVVHLGRTEHSHAILIPLLALEIGFDELREECARYHAKYGGRKRRIAPRPAGCSPDEGDERAIPLDRRKLVRRALRPGLSGIGAAAKLLDNRPGLVLGPEGILDNSGPFAAGFLPWSEISAIEYRKTKRGGGVVIVTVTDPEKYLDSGSRPARLYRRDLNRRLGSPVVLSPDCLQATFYRLKDECARYHRRYGGRRPVPAG